MSIRRVSTSSFTYEILPICKFEDTTIVEWRFRNELPYLKGAPVSRAITKSAATVATTTAPECTSEETKSAGPACEAIAERAYQIYVTNGSKSGTSEENWLQAERELKEKMCSGSCQSGAAPRCPAK